MAGSSHRSWPFYTPNTMPADEPVEGAGAAIPSGITFNGSEKEGDMDLFGLFGKTGPGHADPGAGAAEPGEMVDLVLRLDLRLDRLMAFLNLPPDAVDDSIALSPEVTAYLA